MKQQTLHIDPEFKAQIPPLTEDERKQLEENILADGEILSPILVWNDTIVDGHNRYEILQNHPEISFTVYPLTLENREQVLVWICKNQLGRRNLTPEQKKFLIGSSTTQKSMMDFTATSIRPRHHPAVFKMNTSGPPRKPVNASHGKTTSAPVPSGGQPCLPKA